MSLLTDALGELAAVDGAYSWASNNPVGMSDPSGRHPLTDAEFASWRDSHRTGLAAVGDWVTACDPVTGEALAHTVTATAPTGRTQRVYSFEVDGLQAYYVRTGTTFIAVHNECSELARQLQRRASSGVDRVQEVIRETAESRSKSFTSRYGLTQSEALEAGEQWLGEGYITRDAEQWVFRSADGTRGFRMGPSSLAGGHKPWVPHVHLERYNPLKGLSQRKDKPIVNNHIPLLDLLEE